MAMVVGAAAGGTMRSTSTIANTTISRRTTTIVPNNTKTRVRIGSITPNTGGMPSTGIRQQPRSMDSRGRGPEAGRQPRTPGVTAVVPVKEVVEGLKRVTSVVAGTVKVQVTEGAVEELRPVTSVVAEARRVRLVAAAEEANGRPAIAARRAVALPHAAAVGDPAAAEEVPVAAAGGEDVGKQEIEKNKG